MARRKLYLISGLVLLLLVSVGALWFMFGSSPLTGTGQTPASQDAPLAAVTRWPTPYSTPQWNPTQIAAMQEIYNGTNPGVVIARGTNTTPVTIVLEHGTTATPRTAHSPYVSYEVREYTLPITITKEWLFPDATGRYLEPGLVTFEKMWIFTVTRTGGTFHPGSGASSIWLDNRIIAYASGGPDGVSAFIYDPQLLKEGAAIGVSYGDFPPAKDRYLPERLHFNRPPTP